MRPASIIRKAKLIGIKAFQPTFMSWSYRYRGSAALTHKKKNMWKQTLILNKRTEGIYKSKERKLCHPPQKKRTDRLLIITILPYSAKKKRANAIAEYSTLYPATSSASASGKSNGVLFVSANEIIKNKTQKGNNGNTNQIYSWALTISSNEKLPDSIITEENVAPIESS